MNDTKTPFPQQPVPPIPGAPQPDVSEQSIAMPQVPQVPLPHMGTSNATLPNPDLPRVQVDVPTPSALPPLPDGVSEQAVAGAIAQVERTGSTDGIPPAVLLAACQRIEALARHQGVDLGAPPPAPAGPSNYVEAAVMDKAGTFDRFAQQRDALKDAVAQQRENARRPMADAVSKVEGAKVGASTGESAMDAQTVEALAHALRELDPEAIRLINAIGVLAHTPDILKGLVWIEVVRTIRNLISSEAGRQIDARLNHPPQSPAT